MLGWVSSASPPLLARQASLWHCIQHNVVGASRAALAAQQLQRGGGARHTLPCSQRGFAARHLQHAADQAASGRGRPRGVAASASAPSPSSASVSSSNSDQQQQALVVDPGTPMAAYGQVRPLHGFAAPTVVVGRWTAPHK